MLDASHRAAVRGPTFIRLLARLTGTDLAPPTLSLPDRLSQWIDWPHALALSTALDTPHAAAPDTEEPAPAQASPAHQYAHAQALLTRAINEDPAWAPLRRHTEAAHATDADPARPVPLPDALFFRQRYLSLQHTMETHIGHLRTHLRDQLARHGPRQARLAAIDAVMERALIRRERNLFTLAPTLLTQHFEHLRLSAPPTGQETPDTTAPAAGMPVWLEGFCRDMRHLLLAELDVRLHPAEGLLALFHS